jgi:transposase
MVDMVTIGVDPHKRTHTAVAVDLLGRAVSEQTVSAQRDGFAALLGWARTLDDDDRVWVIEDCRHVSGPLERFLLDHGESVVRLAPRLMAGARHSVRERGKSDPIDALAVARAALREGLETLPTARLSGPELEIRLLAVHRERLVAARTRLINELRWELHDLWPDWDVPKRCLVRRCWQQKVARRLARAPLTARVQIARDEIARIRNLTRTIDQLYEQLADLVTQVAPQLLAEHGMGVLIAAKLIGEIAGAQRFSTDAKLARAGGIAPIPVSSGNTNRHRLDRGGNRQINTAIHRVAITRLRCHPETKAYIASKRAEGKTSTDAIRCLKRHLPRRIWHLLQPPDPEALKSDLLT